MITIEKSGKIYIPQNEGFIGYAGDNLNKILEFKLINQNNSDFYYRMYLKFDDETVNFFILDKKISEDNTILTWKVTEDQIYKDGIVYMQIKAFNTSAEVFHTESVPIFVGKSIEFCNYLAEKSTSEFSEHEKLLNKLLVDILAAKEFLPYIGSDKNWYVYDYEAEKYLNSGVSAAGSWEKYPLVTAVNRLSDNNHIPSAKAVYDFVGTKTGDITYLNTEDKTSLVQAINELVENKISVSNGAVKTNNIADKSITSNKLDDTVTSLINSKANATDLQTVSSKVAANTKSIGNVYTKSEIKSRFAQGISAIYDSNGNIVKASDSSILSGGMLASDASITTAFVSNNVTQIQGGCFSGCTNLKTVYIDNIQGKVAVHSGAIPGTATVIYTDEFNPVTANAKAIAQMYSKKADKGENSIKVVEETNTTVTILPNKYYKFGEVTELNISLGNAADNTILNEYMFEFLSGATATTLILPDTVKWLETPTIEANKLYQCSIVNNIGVLLGAVNE